MWEAVLLSRGVVAAVVRAVPTLVGLGVAMCQAQDVSKLMAGGVRNTVGNPGDGGACATERSQKSEASHVDFRAALRLFPMIDAIASDRQAVARCPEGNRVVDRIIHRAFEEPKACEPTERWAKRCEVDVERGEVLDHVLNNEGLGQCVIRSSRRNPAHCRKG